MQDDRTLFHSLHVEIQVAFTRLLTVAIQFQPLYPAAANFLLAWEDAKQYGGFDVATLASMDEYTVQDIATLVPFIQRGDIRPSMLGHDELLRELIAKYRPMLATPAPNIDAA